MSPRTGTLRMSDTIREKLTLTPQEKTQAQMGIALAHHEDRSRTPIYAGTVDPVTRARRRAKNKAARQARAMHRRKA